MFLLVSVILFTGGACLRQTPLEQTPPLGAVPPGKTPPCPLGQTHPPGADHPPRADTLRSDTPRSRPPPGADTPPPGQTPPRKQTPAYGQRAAGTHPTGMHSCSELKLMAPFEINDTILFVSIPTFLHFPEKLKCFFPCIELCNVVYP